ncbi:MAG: O-antigen ligase family protein [Thiotrichaceae bacterium]
MLGSIVFIPALLAFYVALTQSVQKAFLNVYIPVLFFFPDYYHWNSAGLPEMNVNQTTVGAIIVAWALQGFKGWKFSSTDILVFGFLWAQVYSQYMVTGYKDAQNFAFHNLTSAVFPYILTKVLIEPYGLRAELAKRIVIVLALVTIGLLPQFLFGMQYTLWQLAFGRLFDGQGWLWDTQYRWGFARASGPYGHAIIAGIIMVCGYRLQRWLEWSRAWPARLQGYDWLTVHPNRLFTFIMFAGAFMTMVRGPLSAGIIAGFFIVLAFTRHRWLIFFIALTLGTIIAIPVISWFISYASVGRLQAATVAQSTVAYRWELIGSYVGIGMEKFWWGWGEFTTPRVAGQRSIDNHFLLLFLRHGIVGLGALLLMFAVMMLRLFLHSMLKPVVLPAGSNFGFTLFSLYLVIFWSVATVWMGQQTLPLLFLITGWADGYLRSGRENEHLQMESVETTPRPRFQFKRVLT